MKRQWFSEERIIGILKEALASETLRIVEEMLNGRTSTSGAARRSGVGPTRSTAGTA